MLQKVGQVTGPLADALNWAGESEDAFNEKLAACSSEQERAALITETLNRLYSEAAGNYRVHEFRKVVDRFNAPVFLSQHRIKILIGFCR